MADKDGMKVAKDYHVDKPFARQGGFYVKGMTDVDWGMKTRLASIFQPESGRTVMLAFDHGYFMGSTAGLERLDLVIPPVIDHIDVLMGTRGAFEEITAACPVPIVVAGGKKLPEDEALAMCYHAISEGAAGIDMGRNIFQSLDPSAMAQAVNMIVHKNATDKEAYEFFLDIKK